MSSQQSHFFTPRQFQTLVYAIDILIPANGRILTAEEIALRADQFLDAIDGPSTEDLRRALDLLEFPLPLLILKPQPFSNLSPESRRKLLEKIVSGKGMLRDLARALKLISTFSYYTHEKVRQTIGYVEFENRPQFPGLDTRPHVHAPPKLTT
jgi:hypothetical protein